jgi:hypothetical protein
MEFFDSMDTVQKLFWFIAIPTSVIFLIQTIMTFVGLDAADGVDADFDSDLHDSHAPFQLFSFRNLINFLLGFGWSGVAFYNTISNSTFLILVAFLVGASFVALFFFIMQKIQTLAEDNTFNITHALNKTGEVYIPIPAAKSGKGKVQISIKGSIHELDAITESESRIETGSIVRITGINQQLLIVQKL